MDYESQIKILTGLVAITVLCEEAELSDYDKERGLKRGADGKWTSNKSDGGSAGDIDNEKDIITPEKALAPLDIDKAVKDINKLATETKKAFVDACLRNNDAFKALASALSGAVKDGFQAGEKLLKKAADSIDVEKAWRDFSNESNRVIKEAAKQGLEIARGVGLGAALATAASWGVMSACAAGAAAVALPGMIVGSAIGTETLANVAFQVLKTAGYGMWAQQTLFVILPKLCKQIGLPIGDEGLKAVAKTKVPDTDSDKILALYDVSKDEVEQYKQGLEDKKKVEEKPSRAEAKLEDKKNTESESSGASNDLVGLRNRLDLVEKLYKTYLERSSLGESGAAQKKQLDAEILRIKKEIKASTMK
jgi:hypothetical protein